MRNHSSEFINDPHRSGEMHRNNSFFTKLHRGYTKAVDIIKVKAIAENAAQYSRKSAAAAAAAALIIALAGCSESSNAHADKEPSHSSSAETPRQTNYAIQTPNITAQMIEIPATDTPQEVGEQIFATDITDWNMAGATEENEKYYSSNYTITADRKIANIAGPYDNLFEQTIFTNHALTDPDPQTKQFIQNVVEDHSASLQDYLITEGDPNFTYKYDVTVPPDGVKVIHTDPGDDLTIQVQMTEHDNVAASANLVQNKAVSVNGQQDLMNVDLKKIDGEYKIDAIADANS